MKFHKILTTTILAIGLVFSHYSHASDDDYFYLGLALGGAKTSDDSIFQEKEQSASYLRLGFIAVGWIGLEYGSFGMVEPVNEDKTPPVTSETEVAGSTSLIMIRSSLADRAWLHIGAGSIDYQITVDGTEAYSGTGEAYSLGLDWLFGDNWSLRYEVAKYTKIGPAEADITHTRLGLTYNFF
ncbi:MAG: hypothetical protein OEY52_00610 [Gammaproteobacteria bacterium]|nr:hypothetical protein [Gammaproteobacteria bacterium]